MLVAMPALAAGHKRIAITFDDAPRADSHFSGPERAQRLLGELKAADIQATFFCTTAGFDAEGRTRIAAYRAAEDLESIPGARKWFRFPYLHVGRRGLWEDEARIRAQFSRGGRSGSSPMSGGHRRIVAGNPNHFRIPRLQSIMPSRHGPARLRAWVIAGLLYAGVTCADESRFTPEQLRQDLDFIAAEIGVQHPDPAHSMDAAAFGRAVAALRASLTTPLTRDEAWAAFATLNPLFADAHLVVAYPDWRGAAESHLKAGGGLFPFEISIADDGTPVVTALQGGAPTPFAGRRIRSIDGADARERTAAVLGRVHGDTPAFRRELASRRWFFFDWKLFGAKANYEIAFEGAAAPRTMGAGRAMPVFLADEASFERQFSLEPLPCGAALLTVSAFVWPDKAPFLAFTKDAFTRIQRDGVRTLIIDVRANGGGDDDFWIEGILPYVADRPYRHGSGYRKRVLEKYRDADETAGEVVTGEIEDLFQPEPANPLRFDGKVYVLIGRSTYSSAILFSNVMQDFGFGSLAGAAATARAEQSGSVQQSVLPNTGLVLVWPRFVLQRPSGKADPVLLTPDVVVADDPLHPRAAVEALLRRESATCGAMPASPAANRGR